MKITRRITVTILQLMTPFSSCKLIFLLRHCMLQYNNDWIGMIGFYTLFVLLYCAVISHWLWYQHEAIINLNGMEWSQDLCLRWSEIEKTIAVNPSNFADNLEPLFADSTSTFCLHSSTIRGIVEPQSQSIRSQRSHDICSHFHFLLHRQFLCVRI